MVRVQISSIGIDTKGINCYKKNLWIKFLRIRFLLLKDGWSHENAGHRIGGSRVPMHRCLVYLKNSGNKTTQLKHGTHRMYRMTSVPVGLLNGTVVSWMPSKPPEYPTHRILFLEPKDASTQKAVWVQLSGKAQTLPAEIAEGIGTPDSSAVCTS